MDSMVPTTTTYFNTLSNVHDIPSLIKFYDLMFGTHPFVWIITCVIGIYAGFMLDKYYGAKARVYLDIQKKYFLSGVEGLKR